MRELIRSSAPAQRDATVALRGATHDDGQLRAHSGDRMNYPIIDQPRGRGGRFVPGWKYHERSWDHATSWIRWTGEPEDGEEERRLTLGTLAICSFVGIAMWGMLIWAFLWVIG